MDLNKVTENECVKIIATKTRAKVVQVYDGDTITIIYFITENCPVIMSMRIKGIDTPEIRTTNHLEKQAGLKIRDYVLHLLYNKVFEVEIDDWDKYGGRVLGNLFFENGESLSTHLLNKKYGRPYNGEKKKEWLHEELQFIVDN